jgi:hypothetical protein
MVNWVGNGVDKFNVALIGAGGGGGGGGGNEDFLSFLSHATKDTTATTKTLTMFLLTNLFITQIVHMTSSHFKRLLVPLY